jgi:hypothetical protein
VVVTKLLLVIALLVANLAGGVVAAEDSVSMDGAAPQESVVLEIEAEEITSQLLMDMLAKAKAMGASRLLIPPGVHYVDRTIFVENASDLTIDGQGATLIFTRRVQALSIYNANNLVIKDLTIDYDPLPFTQGVIVAMDPATSTFDVQIDKGYPLDTELVQSFKAREVHFAPIDPVGRTMKPGTLPAKTTNVDKLADDLIRIKLGGADYIGGLVVGDSVVLKSRGAHAINLDRSSNVHLKNVTVHSALGMGVTERNGEGGNRYEIAIVPGPRPEGSERDRLHSTNADGFHSYNMKRGPVVENSRFEMTGDDNLNIHGAFPIIIDKQDNVLIVSPNSEGCVGQGDRIEILDGASFSKIDEAQVVKMGVVLARPEYRAEAEKQWHGRYATASLIRSLFYRLELDRPVQAEVGDIVASLDRMGAGAIVRNSVFRGNGRAILVTGHDALIENNVIEGCSEAGIVLVAEEYWMTGPMPRNMIVRGNTLRNAGVMAEYRISQNQLWGAISVLKRPQQLYGGAAASRDISNIVIEDNIIENSAYYAIMLGNTSGATIRGNTIINKPALSEGVLSRPNQMLSLNSGIFLFESDNVVIDGNVIQHVPSHGIVAIRAEDVNIIGDNQVIGFAEDRVIDRASAIMLDRASNVTISGLKLVDPTNRIGGIDATGSTGIVLEQTDLELPEGAEQTASQALVPNMYDDFLGETLDQSLWQYGVDLEGLIRLENGTLVMMSPAGVKAIMSAKPFVGENYAVRGRALSVATGSAFFGFISGQWNIRMGISSGGHVYVDTNFGGFDRFVNSYPGVVDPTIANDLLLQREGDTFRFYINDVLVAEKVVAGFPTDNVRIFMQAWTSSTDPNDGKTSVNTWGEITYGGEMKDLQPYPAAGEGISLTVYDDFSGGILDASLWEQSLGNGGSVSVEDGKARLVAGNISTLTSATSLTGDQLAVRGQLALVEAGRGFVGLSAGSDFVRLAIGSGGGARVERSIGGSYKLVFNGGGPYDPKAVNDLEIRREGDTFRFYINEALVAEETYSGFPTEDVKFFLMTVASAPPTTSVWNEVSYAVNLSHGAEEDQEEESGLVGAVVYDDFSGDALSGSLWEFQAAEAFRLKQGTLEVTSAKQGQMTVATSTMSLAGRNFAVNAKLQLVENGQGYIGFTAGSDYCRMALGSGGGVRGEKSVGGSYERFLNQAGVIVPTDVNEMRLERDGDTFRLYVNGMLVAEKVLVGFPTEDVKLFVATFASTAKPGVSVWDEISYSVGK